MYTSACEKEREKTGKVFLDFYCQIVLNCLIFCLPLFKNIE